jgi:WD40 repeat protein
VTIWATGRDLREIDTLQGHRYSVDSVEVTRDGRFAVTGSSDQTIRIWDIAGPQGVEILRLQATAGIRETAAGPDVTELVAALNRPFLRVWRLPADKKREVEAEDVASCEALAVSPDCKYAVSGNRDGSATLWSLPDVRLVRHLPKHEEGITAVEFSPDGSFLITGGKDKTARIWNAATQETVAVLEHADLVFGVTVAAGGVLAAIAGGDGGVQIWDPTTKQHRGLRGHEGRATAVALTPDLSRLLVGGHDGSLRIWDLRVNGRPPVVLGHHGQASVDNTLVSESTVNAIVVANDARFAVSAGADRTVRIWDLLNLRELRVLTGHHDSVRSVSLSPDGRFVVGGSWDETLVVWRLDDGREVARLSSASLTGCCVFAARDQLLAGDSRGRLLRYHIERLP